MPNVQVQLNDILFKKMEKIMREEGFQHYSFFMRHALREYIENAENIKALKQKISLEAKKYGHDLNSL